MGGEINSFCELGLISRRLSGKDVPDSTDKTDPPEEFLPEGLRRYVNMW